MLRAWVGLAAWLLLVQAQPVSAQAGPLTGEPFNIDFVTGPVLGSHVDIGMGGARTAMAMGSDGAAFNPASYASRGLWQLDWFDWDLSFDFIPGSLRNTDFDNNGEVGFTYDDFVFITVGGGLKLGAFGMGVITRVQNYSIGPETGLTFVLANYGVGYAFLDGALVLGVGGRTAALDIARVGSSESLVSFTGTGLELGAQYRPHELPFRVGVAARPAVFSRPLDNTSMAAGLTLPAHIKLPWELQAGLAVQLGPRPLNRAWENPNELEDRLSVKLKRDRYERMARQLAWEADRMAPPQGAGQAPGGEPRDPTWWERERRLRSHEEQQVQATLEAREQARRRAYEALPRGHWLLAADLILTGPSEDAIGTEAFLSQAAQPSGKHVSLGVRAGVETEPIDNRLKVRLGSYLEPSRFAGVGYRAHLTTGGEVRLFRWDVFGLFSPFDVRIGLTFDVASRYLNWILGIGFWH